MHYTKLIIYVFLTVQFNGIEATPMNCGITPPPGNSRTLSSCKLLLTS